MQKKIRLVLFLFLCLGMVLLLLNKTVWFRYQLGRYYFEHERLEKADSVYRSIILKQRVLSNSRNWLWRPFFSPNHNVNRILYNYFKSRDSYAAVSAYRNMTFNNKPVNFCWSDEPDFSELFSHKGMFGCWNFNSVVDSLIIPDLSNRSNHGYIKGPEIARASTGGRLVFRTPRDQLIIPYTRDLPSAQEISIVFRMEITKWPTKQNHALISRYLNTENAQFIFYLSSQMTDRQIAGSFKAGLGARDGNRYLSKFFPF